MDGAQGSSFINKPLRGWLHPDKQLAEEGVCYGVRYIGALEVNTSMKSLNFDTRSLIAKECIAKVCEAAGLKTVDRKKKKVKSVGRVIGDTPLMDHAGSNVSLTITSSSLTLTTYDTPIVIASHEMPNISFASGGDPDTLDFIAYVARDEKHGRACFVLECGGGLAQDVITTIGQAFELRFKEYLRRAPPPVQYINVNSPENPTTNGDDEVIPDPSKPDREYYNDLPGKLPPDLVPPNPGSNPGPDEAPIIPPLPSTNSTLNNLNRGANRGSENLIDFSEGACPLAATSCVVQAGGLGHSGQNGNGVAPSTPAALKAEPEYVNDAVVKQNQRDPFDMQPFNLTLNQMNASQDSLLIGNSLSPQSQSAATPISGSDWGSPRTQHAPPNVDHRKELMKEIWFHGPISRKDSENLLKKDGDFLVRESQGNSGQYVLTGLQKGVKKHLLLINPEGVVRTKSMTFDSVSHLINYHRDNQLPIVSAESALLLRYPVPRGLT